MLSALVDVYWYTWFPGSLLATLGVLVLCWKGVTAFTKIHAAAEKIAIIEHEFYPNSGSSMRDKVDAMGVEQQRVAVELKLSNVQMANHIASDATSFTRQERTNARLEATLDRIEDHVRGK